VGRVSSVEGEEQGLGGSFGGVKFLKSGGEMQNARADGPGVLFAAVEWD